MIDEFQDTSRMQWDNFRLLLLEGLSQGADSLIVGDVKQSIYRWRNGDWGILNGLGEKDEGSEVRDKGLGSFPIRIETLKTNRRSETNIIRFNNGLFTAAVDYLNTLHLEELKEDCYPLKRAYADVVQESPKSDERGYVKASFLEPDEEHNYTEQTLLSMGKEVQNLLATGVRLNDITILVRKNKNIPPYCRLLRQGAPAACCLRRSVPAGCLACHLHADRCLALFVQSGRQNFKSFTDCQL